MTGGAVSLEGMRIDQLPRHEFREVRGRRIGMIFQDPLTSLDPLQTIERQLIETMQDPLGMAVNEETQGAIESLANVGMENAPMPIRQSQHQCYGGLSQRIVIDL